MDRYVSKLQLNNENIEITQGSVTTLEDMNLATWKGSVKNIIIMPRKTLLTCRLADPLKGPYHGFLQLRLIQQKKKAKFQFSKIIVRRRGHPG